MDLRPQHAPSCPSQRQPLLPPAEDGFAASLRAWTRNRPRQPTASLRDDPPRNCPPQPFRFSWNWKQGYGPLAGGFENRGEALEPPSEVSGNRNRASGPSVEVSRNRKPARGCPSEVSQTDREGHEVVAAVSGIAGGLTDPRPRFRETGAGLPSARRGFAKPIGRVTRWSWWFPEPIGGRPGM